MAQHCVLFIDDYDATDMIMSVVLADLGYDYRYAATAEEGLAALDKATFDVVLVDIHLPDMRGDALAQRIRSHEKQRNIYIIGYTADLNTVSSEMAAHFDAVKEKTMQPQDIEAMLTQAMLRKNH